MQKTAAIVLAFLISSSLFAAVPTPPEEKDPIPDCGPGLLCIGRNGGCPTLVLQTDSSSGSCYTRTCSLDEIIYTPTGTSCVYSCGGWSYCVTT